jgi:hypothetical protein
MSREYQQKIDDLFDERCYTLSSDQILKMNSEINSGEFNNVIVGLKKENFGLIGNDTVLNKSYDLVYINGITKLQGSIVKLNVNDEERDGLTFYFARYLAQHFSELDVVDTFNTYQEQLRSYIEKLGYITIDSNTADKFKNPVYLIPGRRGLYKITILEKVAFYKSFFNDNVLQSSNSSDKYIYLMLHIRNNHFKIGSSKNVGFREKTLQAQEPEVKLITYWPGSISIEKQLHKQFAAKRQRGEWFRLNFADIEELRVTMETFSPI